MRSRRGLVAIFPLLAFLACRPIDLGDIQTCRVEQRNTQFTDSKLEGILATDRDCYRKDEPVHITFTVKNISNAQIQLQNDDASVIHLEFLDFFGTERYVWEAMMDSADLPRHISLEPAEVYSIEWRVIPDGYVGRGVSASVHSDGVRLIDISLGITGPR